MGRLARRLKPPACARIHLPPRCGRLPHARRRSRAPLHRGALSAAGVVCMSPRLPPRLPSRLLAPPRPLQSLRTTWTASMCLRPTRRRWASPSGGWWVWAAAGQRGGCTAGYGRVPAAGCFHACVVGAMKAEPHLVPPLPNSRLLTARSRLTPDPPTPTLAAACSSSPPWSWWALACPSL